MLLSQFFKGVYYGRYDKTVHITSSLLLTFFGLLIWPSAAVVGIVICLGIGKELRDMFRPGDRFDWYDIMTNIAGVGIGYVLWHFTSQWYS